MNTEPSQHATTRTSAGADVDVVIVGAGFAGIYMLYGARRRGLSARLFESGDGVGGTWYWNRYPGARVDLESVEYSYSFSKELEQEWRWTERYASQPELMRYMNHVVDRFDLRRDIQFRTRVASAVYDEGARRWRITTDRGEQISASFLALATGFLSAPLAPAFKGLDKFAGRQYQTSRWPHEKVDFEGQRVGIIGTGSSGIQCVPTIAQEAAELFVFQRTANYIVPLQNCPMPADFERMVKDKYAYLRRVERNSFGGFVLAHFAITDANPRSAFAVSAAEREEEYEYRWTSGGLCFYNSYRDLLVDPAANETLAEFLRAKVRKTVADPAVAEALVPRDFRVLTKRLCADTNYYEAFNRDNVTLVDIRNSGIEEFTARGVKANGKEYPLDSVVFATGFDAVSGAILRIDIRGKGGIPLQERWKDGPQNHLGMTVAGFPNLFILNGPGSPCFLFNPVLLSEDQGEWVLDAIDYVRARGLKSIEPTTAAEQSWTVGVAGIANQLLFPETNSWYMGANVPGKPRVMLAYLGGYPGYKKAYDVAAANAYKKEFVLSA